MPVSTVNQRDKQRLACPSADGAITQQRMVRTMLRSIACILVILLGVVTMCMAQGIEQFTVSRDDTYHESWPDVALAANGDLVCAYQDSAGHGGGPV